MKPEVQVSKPVNNEDKMEQAGRLALQGVDYVDNIPLNLEVTVGSMRAIVEKFEAIMEALR